MLINLRFLHVFCASALVEVRLTTCRSETRAAGSAPHRFALSVLLSRTKRLQCRPSRQHRKVRRAFPELRRNEMGERACSMCGTVRGRLARHSGASGADMEPFWANFWAVWGEFRGSETQMAGERRLGRSGGPLGELWGPSGGRPEPFLGAHWGHLGPSWGRQGPSWGHLGAILALSLIHI